LYNSFSNEKLTAANGTSINSILWIFYSKHLNTI
jgi:hypothetical protein